MRCPHCYASEDKVIDSRTCKEGEAIRRRRECISCGKRFTTYEEIVRAELFVIKNDGRREEFSPANIRRGIELACWKRQVTQADLDHLILDITRTIYDRVESEIKSSEIGGIVMAALQEFDDVAYIRFASVYRQFADVDEFIKELKEITSVNKKSRKKQSARVTHQE